jgi:hypothetical protein
MAVWIVPVKHPAGRTAESNQDMSLNLLDKRFSLEDWTGSLVISLPENPTHHSHVSTSCDDHPMNRAAAEGNVVRLSCKLPCQRDTAMGELLASS